MDNTQFFYRNIPFTRKDGQVALVDLFQPENSTPLDGWLGTVVSLADGFHTIQQLIEYMGSQYPNPPEKLEDTLHSVITRLIDGGIIQVSQRVTTLPYYLSAPIEELDNERARKSAQDEGDTLSKNFDGGFLQ